jgi:uncharacterized membrane protein HdeD (DUF308 family)
MHIGGSTMLTYVFLFLAASALLFQGAQLIGEVRNPLGVVPAEVALPEKSQRRWGERLFTFGLLSILLAFLSFRYPSLAEYLVPTIIVDGCALGVFALYLVFFAPSVDYMGKPSGGEHH